MLVVFQACFFWDTWSISLNFSSTVLQIFAYWKCFCSINCILSWYCSCCWWKSYGNCKKEKVWCYNIKGQSSPEQPYQASPPWRGSQILFWQGFVAWASKPIPIIEGHFGWKWYPYLVIFVGGGNHNLGCLLGKHQKLLVK